jgi:hypothetical protein
MSGTTMIHATGDYKSLIDSGERFRQAPRLLQRNVGSEIVLSVGSPHGCYHLCGTAAAIWRSLSEESTLPELIAALSMIYEMPARSIASDVALLVSELIDRDLVIRSSDGA